MINKWSITSIYFSWTNKFQWKKNSNGKNKMVRKEETYVKNHKANEFYFLFISFAVLFFPLSLFQSYFLKIQNFFKILKLFRKKGINRLTNKSIFSLYYCNWAINIEEDEKFNVEKKVKEKCSWRYEAKITEKNRNKNF